MVQTTAKVMMVTVTATMMKMAKVKMPPQLKIYPNSLFTGIEQGGTHPKSQTN